MTKKSRSGELVGGPSKLRMRGHLTLFLLKARCGGRLDLRARRDDRIMVYFRRSAAVKAIAGGVQATYLRPWEILERLLFGISAP